MQFLGLTRLELLFSLKNCRFQSIKLALGWFFIDFFAVVFLLDFIRALYRVTQQFYKRFVMSKTFGGKYTVSMFLVFFLIIFSQLVELRI